MFKRTDVQPYLSVTLCSNPNDQQCRMQLHPHLRAGYQSYRDRINENIRPISCEMTGTYSGRSRHRLPRREGARIAGRPGGAPQYVPADMYPPATVSPQKCVRCHLLPSTCHGIPAKAFQVSFSASHLPRNPRKSVPCSTSCLPPAAAVPLIMGCRDFSAGQISSFQQEASNHRHT